MANDNIILDSCDVNYAGIPSDQLVNIRNPGKSETSTNI